MPKKLRIAFMGTPEFASAALHALINSTHDIVCVYTQPPRPKGRGKQIQKSPVHVMAERAGIEARHPVNFKNPNDVEEFKNLNLDIAVVAAYGLILPPSILESPKYGCINIHASLLPRWRGAAPIHRAILAGDTQTGITLMQMDAGLDTGDMIAVGKTEITPLTTLPLLHDELAIMGASMIIPCLDELVKNGTLNKIPQSLEGMTYAKMLSKEEGHIDWTQNTAQEIERQIRALNPWPGTWCMAGGKRLKILTAHISEETSDQKPGTILENGHVVCGHETILILDKVQPENKTPMDMKASLNGSYINIGDVLT